MTLDEHLHAFYNLLADDVAAWLEAGMAGAAAAGVARPVALAADFAPLQRAVDRIRSKTPVASEMRSAEWAEVPLQIRNRAQLSAGVVSARVVQDIQRRMENELQWKAGDGIGRDAFIRGMRETLAAEGMATNPQGGLTDISSNRRLELIYDMQTRDARNYAKWKVDMDPDLLEAAPAQELVRERDSKEKRDWRRRWAAAGGEMRGGRMAAHKQDPVWLRLSRFGSPWPPYDYNSGMGVEDILAEDARELGIEPPRERDAVTEQRYNERAEAEVRDLDPARVAWLQERLGGQVAVVDGVARLTPLSWRTVAEADAWAAEAYAGMRVDAGERAALTAYQDRSTGAQRRMSEWLREGREPDAATRGQVRSLDAVIARSNAAANGIAYRCVDLDAGELRYSDRAHMSATLCEQIAWQRYGRQAKSPVMLKIYLPKGTKGVYLSQFTGENADRGEGEFLLQRGTMLTHVNERFVEVEGRKVREVLAIAAQGEPANLDWRPAE